MTGQQQQNDGNGTEAKPPKVEFTPEQHEEINRIVAARTSEAARKAAADRQAEIDAYLAAQKAEAEKAEMAEIDRLKAEQAEAVARAEAAEQAAKTATRQSEATTALVAANAKPDRLTDLLRLVDLDADDLAAEVAAVAERLPELFNNDDTPPPPAPRPGIQPGGHDRNTPGGKSAADRAKARFDAKYPRPAA